MSKVIQIAANNLSLYALCDDGSIWGIGLTYDRDWKRVKAMPVIPAEPEPRTPDASMWELPAPPTPATIDPLTLAPDAPAPAPVDQAPAPEAQS